MKKNALFFSSLLFFLPSPLIAFQYIEHFSVTDTLTPEMKRYYEANGFLIFDNFLTAEQCDVLKKESQRIIEEFDATQYCSVFSITNPATRDHYFFDSIDKVRCFLEPETVCDGKLIVDKKSAVNKIAHALHDKNPVFEKVTFSSHIIQYVHDLEVTNPIVIQSMVILKSANVGNAVPPHQDATFLYTDPISVVGFWIPLDDASIQNGCLWVIPGSHKENLRCRQRVGLQKNLFFEVFDSRPWPEEEFVPIPLIRGSLIILSGTLAHKSEKNRSPFDRNAYTFHVMSGDAHYPDDNWLQRKDSPKLITAR